VKKRVGKRLATIVSAVIMFIAPIFVWASPASAYIAGCQVGYSSVGAYAHCSQGDSASYRVVVLCQNRFTLDSRNVYGPWVPRGGQTPSVVSGCEWYEHFYGTPWAQGS